MSALNSSLAVLALPLTLMFAGDLLVEQVGQDPIDFDRDVRPLLVDRCFACHGPDASSRETKLRLDTREGATQDLGGYAAVVPGDAKGSELWLRITATQPSEVMPPPKAHKEALTPGEQSILSRWINEGAPWSRHWAFVPPVKRPTPNSDAHPIDAFIEASLAADGRSFAPEADARQLARRLSFDLRGLPPKLEQLTPWIDNATEDDWGLWVDQLLASPEYAERMAMWWLDAARYADTDGFQIDEVRSNWPWRDWVVEAFGQNMRFDRFTELQFAGDLLENASPEDVLATCFHRNHMHNGEGGRDPEESRVDYVRDRINTVGSLWLGLTLECAQCHDHKFDPVSQGDYYGLSAFFDDIDETGSAGSQAGPFLPYRSTRVQESIAIAEREHLAAVAFAESVQRETAPAFEVWLRSKHRASDPTYQAWQVLEPRSSSCATAGAQITPGANGVIERSGASASQEEYVIDLDPADLDRVTGLELEILASKESPPGFGPLGEFILTGVSLQILRGDQRIDIALEGATATEEGGGVVDKYGPVKDALDDDPRTGWRVGSVDLKGEDGGWKSTRARFDLGEVIDLIPGDQLQWRLLFRSQVESAYPARLRVRATREGGAVPREWGVSAQEELSRLVAANVPVEEVPQELRERLREQFLEGSPEWVDASHRRSRLGAQLSAAKRAAEELKVTVLRERTEQRTTYILERGAWDKKGAVVDRHYPVAVFEQGGPNDQAEWTRLDLAHWITDTRNPLTSRVIVNQVWQLLFGSGLVRTPADFGLQGQRPLYPEVLDWLAVEFIESGWDLQHLIRLIVGSRVYRQSSKVSPELLSADPGNALLARGARFRLPSWMIRDAALSVSGLLDQRLGGPPVFPHQPAGVWEDMFMGRFRYEPTLGQARHRRSLYTFWRRNSAPTFFFDNADRRFCAVDARRTNTPLHALTLLNDRTFSEAAGALARRAWKTNPRSVDDQIRDIASSILLRDLEQSELGALLSLHAKTFAMMQADAGAAMALASSSDLDPVPTAPHEFPAEIAALSAVATVVLNLDEAITHE